MKATLRKRKTSVRGDYKKLLTSIGATIEIARGNAARTINSELVKANWEIGRNIVQFEQRGNERAEYGSELLNKLSKDLKLRYGKGFSRRNVLDMRRFFLSYPIWQAVPAKLSWTHIVLLLGLSNSHARKFYERQSTHENWSYRELEREIESSLFERLTLSRSKRVALKKTKNRTVARRPVHIVKDPYVLDFLKIPQHYKVTEKHLEQKIIDNLQMFLLELGKGFAFVGRQYKISLRSKHYYIDLVFYHRILKCFVLVDLKTKPVSHADIGQMNLYLNYMKKEENTPGDGEPIGIILSADKDEVLVEYATGGISNKIFISQYQLYLPQKKQLENQVKAFLP